MPDHWAKNTWDFIIFVQVICLSIYLPYNLSFEIESTNLENLILFIDACFMIDILLNFNTGIYFKNYLVVDRKQIAKNYLKTWFAFDLIASIPIDLIFRSFYSSSNNQI